MPNPDQNSSKENLVDLLAGTAKTSVDAVVKPISFRIYVTSLARADAFAAKAGKSRNAMLNMLVGVGLDEVFSRLYEVNEEAFEEVQSRETFAMEQLFAEGFDDQIQE